MAETKLIKHNLKPQAKSGQSGVVLWGRIGSIKGILYRVYREGIIGGIPSRKGSTFPGKI